MTDRVEPYLRVIPLGGAGEFGSNCTVIQSPSTSILIDNGLLFPPDQREPGVEYYVRDPDQILQNFPDLSAIVVTHGHEDHVGGIPFLLERRSLPIYAQPYTAELIRQKMIGSGIDLQFVKLSPDHAFSIGDLSLRAIEVTHSIVGSCAIVVRNDAGSVMHSGDFKVDPLPENGDPFPADRFRAIGDQGVDILLVDSTNAHRTGFCPSEFTIEAPLEAAVREAPGRVFFTTFASHIPRLRKLITIARRTGRKIVLMGRSVMRHYLIALETHALDFSPDLFVDVMDASRYQDRELIFVITGSQGERNSVLARIARDRYQKVALKADDTVIFSSRSIPGNERIIALLISAMEEKGVKVITSADRPVHTSGHGFREDTAFLLSLIRPKTVVPIHGEYHHLLTHYDWLKQINTASRDVVLVENGDFLTLRRGVLHQDGHLSVRLVPIDGNQEVPLQPTVLQERKNMMYSGLMIINGRMGPRRRYRFDVVTHGVAEPEPGFVARETQAALNALNQLPKDHPMIAQHLIKTTKAVLREFFNGCPMIKIILDGKICV